MQEKESAAAFSLSFPGHMEKTTKVIQKQLKGVQVVIELLDARLPVSSRNLFFNSLLHSKKRLFVLHKKDLVSKAQEEKWLRHYRSEFQAAKQTNHQIIALSSCQKKLTQRKKNFKQLLHALRELLAKEKKLLPKTLRLMLVGIPNVGKSSFINSLSSVCTKAVKNSGGVGKRAPRALAGKKAGLTLGPQWLKLLSPEGKTQLELLDLPGVLPLARQVPYEAALKLALLGSLKDETLELPQLICEAGPLLPEALWLRLAEHFELDNWKTRPPQKRADFITWLEQLGERRGFLNKKKPTEGRSTVELSKSAHCLLKQLRSSAAGAVDLS